MSWYERLAGYFPDAELKSAQQMADLEAAETGYRIEEQDDYVMVYAEFDDFLFIDYLLVNARTRGAGVGGKVLAKCKQRGKPIVIEVEPASHADADTRKRIRFYERNGFVKAEHIEYVRETDDGHPHAMHVYFWAPAQLSERAVLRFMATVCRNIHNYRALRYYGREIADPEEVLTWIH